MIIFDSFLNFNTTNISILEAIIISLILGMLHGITPDEHTWPITFSYAVGSYSTKKGVKAGFFFSAGFTLQRAILTELAYFALISIFETSIAFGITYIIVGLAMALAGLYIAKRGYYLHWHYIEEKLGDIFKIHKKNSKYQKLEFEHKINPINSKDSLILKEVPLRLAFVHGLIAGFGFGAFALILVTVITPAMPGPLFAWLPGFMFGIGTMIMQMIFGGLFGTILKKKKSLTQEGIAFVSKYISKNVLFYGGLVFSIAGILIIIWPNILNFGISTGIDIPNLDSIDIGFILVVVVVGIIGIVSYLYGVKKAIELGYYNKN